VKIRWRGNLDVRSGSWLSPIRDSGRLRLEQERCSANEYQGEIEGPCHWGVLLGDCRLEAWAGGSLREAPGVSGAGSIFLEAPATKFKPIVGRDQIKFRHVGLRPCQR